jgi:beta-lactamase class A
VIPVALGLPDLQAHLEHRPLRPPAIIAPAPREVSFGRIAGTVSPRTVRVLVKVDGSLAASAPPAAGRFDLAVPLPARDVRVRVVAVDASGNRASRSVAPVYGLPRAGRPTGQRPSAEDRPLARRLRTLAGAFPGVTGVYVQDLHTRVGAAWNAGARFPAASTVKLAIAVEVLRTLPGKPVPGSSVDRELRSMLVHSDNEAANSLLVRLGGSTSGGASEVNATLGRVGIGDSLLYGGYAVGTAAAPRIPVRVERQPAFGVGKYTTAYDLARLHRLVHMAAGSRGVLVRLQGSFTAADARFLLWTLAHVEDPGKLDRDVPRRFRVLHKAGWIVTARHDAGLVYSRRGAFVAAVMTWSPGGVGVAADVLAARVAAAALDRFRELRRHRQADAARFGA